MVSIFSGTVRRSYLTHFLHPNVATSPENAFGPSGRVLLRANSTTARKGCGDKTVGVNPDGADRGIESGSSIPGPPQASIHPGELQVQMDGRIEPEMARSYRAPKVVAPNSAFWVEGCERQYCGGASTWPPSCAAACQPQRGS
jgi:hypothetical protein